MRHPHPYPNPKLRPGWLQITGAQTVIVVKYRRGRDLRQKEALTEEQERVSRRSHAVFQGTPNRPDRNGEQGFSTER